MKSGPGVICRDEQRRAKVREQHWNGLDYVEVESGAQQATVLRVFFLGKAPNGIKKENVVIRGCRPGAREVRVVEDLGFCIVHDAERDDCLQITLDRPGNSFPYELCLVEVDAEGCPTGKPFPGFDPRYACVEFTFTVDCQSGLDCKTERIYPPEPREEPVINYLAKDYASFRQLILDRLALTLPEWKERHVPDLGIALVEVLAYVGDYLSYYQDAVATEAYLDTARRRISVRRHARLVDYPMHEGCNARAWVFVETGTDRSFKTGDFYFITGFDPAPPEGKPLTKDDLPAGGYLVFEPVTDDPAETIEFREAHNEIRFYTWDDAECCLPRGATRATLRDAWKKESQPPPTPPPHGYSQGQQEEECEPPPASPPRERTLSIKVGDLVLLEELIGPRTGQPGDADRSHRHVVRLTCVEESVDGLNDQPVLEIEWALEDALPFPLCISAVVGEHCQMREVSVARGNVLLVDHGSWVHDKDDSWCVPPGNATPRCEGEGRLAEVPQTAGRFNPVLKWAPLTFRQPLPQDSCSLAAARLLVQDPRQARPQIRLSAKPAVFQGVEWSAQGDLLESGPDDLHFVAEVDDDGRAHLRFGNGDMGFAPPVGAAFEMVYRVGNGRAGNVGAGAIRHLVLRGVPIFGTTFHPRNPLPARGGVDPEPLADVRLLAPHAFRTDLQRAVTADDYALLVQRDFAGRVQRAAATLRWTGSWTEALVAVDPWSGETDIERLLREIRGRLHRYRRIGHEVVVRQAVPVPLDLALTVCVKPHTLRGHVRAALLDVLGDRALADGRRGFFHPDNLTFGEGISLSRLIAAAQAVTGVESVQVDRFQRLDREPAGEIASGFLPLGPLEIARLGKLDLNVGGGR